MKKYYTKAFLEDGNVVVEARRVRLYTPQELSGLRSEVARHNEHGDDFAAFFGVPKKSAKLTIHEIYMADGDEDLDNIKSKTKKPDFEGVDDFVEGGYRVEYYSGIVADTDNAGNVVGRYISPLLCGAQTRAAR
jgi:hypothetical protein